MAILYPRLNIEGLKMYRILFFVLVLIAGLRYNVGVDTYSYTKEFQTFPTIYQLDFSFIKQSNYQILWILFESVLRTFTSSFYVLQFTLAIFVNFVVFKTVRKYSISPFLTMVFYFLFFYFNLNMEILRESIPICLLLVAIPFLIERKLIRYLIISTIAFFFHESGIILFIVPFIFYLRISKKYYFITIIVLFSISSIVSFYFTDFVTNLNFLFNQSKVSSYFTPVDRSAGTDLFIYIKYIIFPSLVLFISFKTLTEMEKKVIFLYIICSILYVQIIGFFRIRDYFLLLFLISVSNAIMRGFRNKTYNNFLRIAYLSIFLFVFLFRYYYAETNQFNLYSNYYPYNSIFNERIPESRMLIIKNLGK